MKVSMNRISGDSIKIIGLHAGDGGLLMYGENTVENARKTIDENNAKRIREGWIKEPENYLIVCHEWYRYEDADGVIIREEEYTNVIERYPA